MSWTDERVATLTKMWGEGQSASQIAKELGGVTRNAVIGKVHRLGLSNRTGAASATAKAASKGAKAKPAAKASETAAAPPQAQTASQTASQATPQTASQATPAPANSSGPATQAAAPAGNQTGKPPMSAARRAIIPAGQPLPPQPSANEISPEALASVREVEKTAKKLTLMQLTERTCKWPIGDPATDEFWFCGLPSQPGKPYCEAHVGVAFQPMSARRDRRR